MKYKQLDLLKESLARVIAKFGEDSPSAKSLRVQIALFEHREQGGSLEMPEQYRAVFRSAPPDPPTSTPDKPDSEK